MPAVVQAIRCRVCRKWFYSTFDAPGYDICLGCSEQAAMPASVASSCTGINGNGAGVSEANRTEIQTDE
jgi:hypothetical protein